MDSFRTPRTRLAVDVGAVTTVAALDRDGHRTVVVFGDQITIPTPVVGEDGRDLIAALGATRGEQAEQVVAGLAEHLRAVAAQAGPIDLTVLTAPPWWGPRHQEAFTRAARLAGWQTTQVLSEAAAVATRVFAHAPQGALVLTCQLDQRASHVTVVQRHHDGWVRVATQQMPAATGQRLDQALADLVIGHPQVGDAVIAQLAQARRQLTAGEPAAVVLPERAEPISLSPHDLDTAAQPLRQMVADAVADTLDAAGVDAVRLHGAVLYGDSVHALTPAADAVDWLAVGVSTAEGRLTAVYGALDTVVSPSPPVDKDALRAGWGRYGSRLAAPMLAALAGMLLLWQTFDVVARLMPPEIYRLDTDYAKLAVYFNPAAFATAGWALTLACLAAGHNLATALLAGPSASSARAAGRVYAFSAVVGLSIATLQGLLAQALVGGPAASAPPYLSSALAGAAIPATTAIVIGLAARRLHGEPPWTERVRFPITPMLLAAAGILAVRARSSGLLIGVVPDLAAGLAGICGAGLLGVAIALTVVTQPAARFVLGTLMAAAGMIIIGPSNLRSTIVVYLVTVALWWILAASRIAADSLPPGWWRNAGLTGTASGPRGNP